MVRGFYIIDRARRIAYTFTVIRKFSWHKEGLRVKKTGHSGWGVYTVRAIRKNTIIARLGGHVMTLEEEKKLPRSMRDICHQIDENFVFGPVNSSKLELTDRFNHSCEPNCGFGGQIFIVAMRNIKAGEQLTFDYAMVLGDKTKYRLRCHCGSKMCRKFVTGRDWRLPHLQHAYRGYFQWYIEEKIKRGRIAR